MPPWAHVLDPSPSSVLVMTMQSPSVRAAVSPATPEPTTMARGSLTSALLPPGSDRQHPVDGQLGALRHRGIDEHLMLHIASAVADLLHGDPLHVGTQVAGTDELCLG